MLNSATARLHNLSCMWIYIDVYLYLYLHLSLSLYLSVSPLSPSLSLSLSHLHMSLSPSLSLSLSLFVLSLLSLFILSLSLSFSLSLYISLCHFKFRRESSGGMEWLGVWNCSFSGSQFQILESELEKFAVSAEFQGFSCKFRPLKKYFLDSGKWPFHTPQIHTPTECRPKICMHVSFSPLSLRFVFVHLSFCLPFFLFIFLCVLSPLQFRNDFPNLQRTVGGFLHCIQMLSSSCFLVVSSFQARLFQTWLFVTITISLLG